MASMQILKRVHLYGHVYVIPMDFPKWQQMVITQIALMLKTELGVSFSLSLSLPEFLSLKFHQLYILETDLDELMLSESLLHTEPKWIFPY